MRVNIRDRSKGQNLQNKFYKTSQKTVRLSQKVTFHSDLFNYIITF